MADHRCHVLVRWNAGSKLKRRIQKLASRQYTAQKSVLRGAHGHLHYT